MYILGVRLSSSFAERLQGYRTGSVHGHFSEATHSLKCIEEASNDIDASILLE